MRLPIATTAVALLLIAAAFASAKGNLIGVIHDSTAAKPGPGPHATGIRVGGNVSGLYPGAQRRMKTTVRNRSGRAVRLRAIRVRAQRAGPACSARYLIIRNLRHGHRVVPRGRKARVGLRVSMRPTAPDACQGASFPLRFKARVDGVERAAP